VQNLADIFDKDSETAKVSMATVAEGIWNASHGNNEPVGDYTLTETTVTSNQPLSDMMAKKLSWKTEKSIKGAYKLSYEFDGDSIDLEPLRIRVFTLEFDQI